MQQLTKAQQANLKQARTMLENIMREVSADYHSDLCIDSPYVAADYCRSRIGCKNREVFTVLFLDNQNRFIKAEDLFFGTINQAEVHPREIIREALMCNAAAILVAHNHPSGECTPSQADKNVTKKIQKACDVMDIRLLDHIIVSKKGYYSFTERSDFQPTQMKLIN